MAARHCTGRNDGCKEEKNITRFYSRTAGMLYLFRPCGVRLSHVEMYTAESLSAVFVLLVDVFGENPSRMKYKALCTIEHVS